MLQKNVQKNAAKLQSAILANSALGVKHFFANNHHAFANIVIDLETEDKDEMKSTGFNGRIPPLMQAVRNVYKSFDVVTVNKSANDSLKIIEILLRHGADTHLATKFRVCDIHNYVFCTIKGTAIDFICTLLLHMPDSDYRSENMKKGLEKAMELIVRHQHQLKINRNRARDLQSVRKSEVPVVTQKTWKSLLFNSDFSDAIFKTDGEEIHAHKAVLAAASPYFHAMFTGSFSESNGKIETSHSQPIVAAVLRYIYTGELSEQLFVSQTLELFAVSGEYQLDDLRTLCSKLLLKQLTVDNVKDTLLVANFHSCEDLKQKIFSFMKKNAHIVLTRPDIMGLKTEDSELWNDLCMAVSGKRTAPNESESKKESKKCRSSHISTKENKNKN